MEKAHDVVTSDISIETTLYLFNGDGLFSPREKLVEVAGKILRGAQDSDKEHRR